ncbi:MAG: trimethylamine methyltransferase family protein, partial [Roseiarcus sp.]
MSNEGPSEDSPRRRRRGGERVVATVAAAPQPRSRFAPVELVSRDELESIHRAALTVLQEIGIDILHDEAKAILRQAGADVDPGSNRVRFDPALVESQIGLAPKSFMLHARNPERNVVIGDEYVAFCSVASTPNAFDRDGGRRPGNYRDYKNFLRLGQTFDSIHVWGG